MEWKTRLGQKPGQLRGSADASPPTPLGALISPQPLKAQRQLSRFWSGAHSLPPAPRPGKARGPGQFLKAWD